MKDKASSTKGNEEIREIPIPVRWGSPASLPTLYANHLYVTHAGGEFYSVFGELSPPIMPRLDSAELPEQIEINPLVKLAIAPEAMKRIVEVLRGNVEKFEEREQKEREPE